MRVQPSGLTPPKTNLPPRAGPPWLALILESRIKFHTEYSYANTMTPMTPVAALSPVAHTAVQALAAKAGLALRGYVPDDPLLLDWAARLGVPGAPRSPLVHRGYYHRRRVVQDRLAAWRRRAPGQAQVLVIGAGLDTLGALLALNAPEGEQKSLWLAVAPWLGCE